MLKNYMKPDINVFIFRRDLRIEDNMAFNDVIQDLKDQDPSIKILPIFIFNPKQINATENIYYSKNAVEFMIQCLKSLSNALKDRLYFFYGKDIDILNKLIKKFQIHTIAFNTDYTPYAKKRDQDIREWCDQKSISVITANDYNLTVNREKIYEIFTPFYKKLLDNIKDIAEPEYLDAKQSDAKQKQKINLTNLLYDDYDHKLLKNLIVKDIDKFYGTSNKQMLIAGGRENALEIIHRINRGEFKNYEKYRDFPALDKTTKLSAYMKYGCLSVRETFYAVRRKYGVNHGLLRELVWREFYAIIADNFPKILQGQISGINHTFKEKYDHIQWGFNQESWELFTAGKTGFPLIDAGVRQLKATGWMHNRVRMVVASFLTKDLLIDWKVGEQWMATQLVDYDPASNNGGWQWASSVGTDAQPYFRIFNPFLQSARFDPDAQYIKQWIPELKNVPAKSIHNWNEDYIKYETYYKPIVNHKTQSEKAIQLFHLSK